MTNVRGGIAGSMREQGLAGLAGMAGANTRNYTLVGALFGLAFPVVATAVTLVQQRLPLTIGGVTAVQTGNPLMWMIDTAPLFLGALAAMAGLRQDELAERNVELAARGQELTVLKTNLEDHVADRTLELENRNIETRAVVQITRQISEIRDTPALMTTAAGMIAQSFSGLDADIYLIESRGDRAVLEASSSADGAAKVKQGYSVDLGDQSVVGQVAAQGKMLITGADQGRDEGTPEASSPKDVLPEIAVALISRGRILGVLHIRYRESARMKETDRELFQLLADQLAAALDNAHLLEQARGSLEQLEQLSGERTKTVWQEYLRQRNVVYRYSPKGIRTASEGLASEGAESLGVPLEIRGQPIGMLTLKRTGNDAWSEVDRDLAQKVADQVALALENTRLLEETRDRAIYEQRASAIADRLGQSVDMDSLLQTAARELASLPEVSDATVFLAPAAEQGDEAP